MPFRVVWDSRRSFEKHPVMSLNSHTIPDVFLSTTARAKLRHWSIKNLFALKRKNLHFWFWPLRKAFRLWCRTLDLTSCTSTLYHHLLSSWHVPFTNVDRSGVWMRIELVWPVICSASATSMQSDMLMLACGIVSVWEQKKKCQFFRLSFGKNPRKKKPSRIN